MKKVKNKASPINTWFGGICEVPIALRKKDNTIIIRVKDVIKIKIDGANAKTVSNKIICIVFTVSCGSVALSTPIVTVGIVRFVVANDTEENIKNIIKTIEINFIFLIICTSNPSFTFYC